MNTTKFEEDRDALNHILADLARAAPRTEAPPLDEDEPCADGSSLEHEPQRDTGCALIDTFDDTELNDEPWPEIDPQTGFYSRESW